MKEIRLSDAQKRIVQQMREYNYLLVFVKGHSFWEFRKGKDKSISYNISSRTAKALADNCKIIEFYGADVEKACYRLTDFGKICPLDQPPSTNPIQPAKKHKNEI